jgi:ubiquinone/menaquinone biosynthesis C-methylase UbiE
MSPEEMTQRMWSAGDYTIVGSWFAEASRSCLRSLSVRGARVLDVACGTGAVAIEAAMLGASEVVGVDLTPAMLEEASRRAAQAQVAVRWEQGSFTELSAFRGFDCVVSAFGVIFAQDGPAVARELVACAQPGGWLVVGAWSPDGVFGGIAPRLVELLPALAARPRGAAWSTAEGLSELLRDAPVGVPELEQRALAVPFASAAEVVEQMRRWSGPWMFIFERLEEAGHAAEGARALEEHIRPFVRARAEGGVELILDYTVARFQRIDATSALG